VATVATGFLSSLGSALGSIGSSLGSAIGGLAPLISPGVQLASAVLAAKQPSRLVSSAGYSNAGYGQAYMPGGMTVPYVPNYGAGGQSGTLGLADIFGGGGGLFPLLGGSDVPSTTGGAVLRGPSRMPRTIEGKDAAGRTRTYVLAPMVRYRVSITRAGRRRCSGGR
jgi:hypothetical protein